MRACNFSAGPAVLPEEVLQQAQEELLDWQSFGYSVMETSHRSKQFIQLAEESEQNLRKLLNISDNYKVLFLQGGARLQFAGVPLNLLQKGKADYIATGHWSERAIDEAKRYGDIHIAASSKEDNYTFAPKDWKLREDIDYVHYTPNETIQGVEYHTIPQVNVPLVADMSSNILSKPLDINKFALIYAGAQKNIGPAGVTIIIVHQDYIGHAHALTPAVMDYAEQAKVDSMLNTPATFSWYMASLVFKWLLNNGGLTAMAEKNQRKSQKLYDFIDNSPFYSNPVAKEDRSWMNVPFTLADSNLDKLFLEQSEKENLVHLKGHRAVGGMRASLYNALPESCVDTLIEFMKVFEKDHG